LRIRSPKELRVWRTAPEGLLEALISSSKILSSSKLNRLKWPNLSATQIELNKRSSRRKTKDPIPQQIEEATEIINKELNIANVKLMLSINDAFLSIGPWVGSYVAPPSEGEGDEEEDEGGGDKDSFTSDWLLLPEASEFIGRRVSVPLDEGEEGGEGFWEDGTVIGYLPPTEEEPMALWKVRLDNDDDEDEEGEGEERKEGEGEARSRSRFEDLELEELMVAIRRHAS
jgi:hypothetical protein